jgi:hypothetical protein
VRKIISILVALGLVLGLSVFAAPVAADVTSATVSVTSTNCACDKGVYNITFNITADLHSGTHSIIITFPDGTVIPATFKDGDIMVSDGGAFVDVFGDEVTVSGQTVSFLVPDDILAVPGPVTVKFDDVLTNPCVAATDYTVWVSTSRAPDSTPVESAEYTIRPATSEYAFVVDFSPTYAGLAEDFVPPFKECGQEGFGVNNGTRWDTLYNFSLVSSVVGCEAPCTNVTVWFEVIACPEDEVITASFNGTWFSLTEDDITEDVGEPGDEDFVLAANMTIANNFTATWNSTIHFSSPGEYEICFYADCLDPICAPPCEGPGLETIATRCFEYKAYQFKEAYKIPVCRKWNLISLPLVPLTDPAFYTSIEDVLAALPDWDTAVISVWYYDQCTGDWYAYDGDDYLDLDMLEDGKAYWVLIDYTPATMGDAYGDLWVWGTAKPVPPASPSAYPVCEGWNMVGYTEIDDSVAPPVAKEMLDTAYLWNFYAGMAKLWGAAYAWNCTSQSYYLVGNMTSGLGYWVSFAVPGTIYPP